jgi:hypothetical protein
MQTVVINQVESSSDLHSGGTISVDHFSLFLQNFLTVFNNNQVIFSLAACPTSTSSLRVQSVVFVVHMLHLEDSSTGLLFIVIEFTEEGLNSCNELQK